MGSWVDHLITALLVPARIYLASPLTGVTAEFNQPPATSRGADFVPPDLPGASTQRRRAFDEEPIATLTSAGKSVGRKTSQSLSVDPMPAAANAMQAARKRITIARKITASCVYRMSHNGRDISGRVPARPPPGACARASRSVQHSANQVHGYAMHNSLACVGSGQRTLGRLMPTLASTSASVMLGKGFCRISLRLYHHTDTPCKAPPGYQALKLTLKRPFYRCRFANIRLLWNHRAGQEVESRAACWSPKGLVTRALPHRCSAMIRRRHTKSLVCIPCYQLRAKCDRKTCALRRSTPPPHACVATWERPPAGRTDRMLAGRVLAARGSAVSTSVCPVVLRNPRRDRIR